MVLKVVWKLTCDLLSSSPSAITQAQTSTESIFQIRVFQNDEQTIPRANKKYCVAGSHSFQLNSPQRLILRPPPPQTLRMHRD